MPHSPRLIGGELFVLEAGAGNLLKIDRGSGVKTVVARLPGFARGLAEHRGFLFVGLSLVRGDAAARRLPENRPSTAGGSPQPRSRARVGERDDGEGGTTWSDQT